STIIESNRHSTYCQSLCIFTHSFFFFQAEDGIRDFHVTGVQTCALPIYGFSSRVWTASRVVDGEDVRIRFSLISPDGDQGFPGEMEVSVTYGWSDDFALSVDYEARSNKPTAVNLTQHSYFNLAGPRNGDIQNHLLRINADFFTCALPDNRVAGEILSVVGTPVDFREAKPIGRDIESDDAQMRGNRGYNQNFVL